MSDQVAPIVASGDRRKSLVVLRDRLAVEVDRELDSRAIVALTKELRSVIAELDGLPGSEEVTPLDRIAGRVADELAGRRAARVADAPAS